MLIDMQANYAHKIRIADKIGLSLNMCELQPPFSLSLSLYNVISVIDVNILSTEVLSILVFSSLTKDRRAR